MCIYLDHPHTEYRTRLPIALRQETMGSQSESLIESCDTTIVTVTLGNHKITEEPFCSLITETIAAVTLVLDHVDI